MKKLLTLIVFALALVLPAGAQNTATPKINKKNLVIKEWNTEPRSGKKVLDHVTTYNPDGKKIEEIEYGSDGQKWRKRFEYGADGKVSRESVYDERNRLQTVKKFEYNEFGRKKVQYTYDAKGKLIDLITPRAYKIAPQGGFYFNHDFEFGAEMPYGTYKLLPISRINGTQEWLPMLGASARYLKLVVEEKKITATPSQSIKINSITSTGSSTRGYTNTFNITNDGAEEFTSAAYVLAASSSGNMANIGLLEPVGLKPGQTASVSVYSDAKVTINAQTSPWVLVIGDSNFNGFYYNSYANYAEADWDLAWQGYIDDDNNYYSDTYKATFIIDNMSCNNAYNHDVTLTLFEKGKDPSKGITLKKNINIS